MGIGEDVEDGCCVIGIGCIVNVGIGIIVSIDDGDWVAMVTGKRHAMSTLKVSLLALIS